MITVKLVSGEICFEEFTNPDIDQSVWTVIPYDVGRYNLTEESGTLKLFHGDGDVKVLTDEELDAYVIDVENNYVPDTDGDCGGLCVFKTEDEYLELLEYFDEYANESMVYKFLRIVRTGNIYTAYGKNVESSEWECVGSATLSGEGKVGLVLKGDALPGYREFHCNYIRIYKSTKIQYINIKYGQRVRLYKEDGTLLATQACMPGYSGVVFDVDLIPPYRIYFQVLNEKGEVIHTTDVFDGVGGDVYYYGAKLNVYVDDELLVNTKDKFLGYYTDNQINYEIRMDNIYNSDFKNLTIEAVQYKEENGHQNVMFSLDGETFTDKVSIPFIKANSSMTIKSRITRDNSLITTYEPFKFYLKINQL